MLKSDDYRLRDIDYLIEFGEFDMARTKLAVLKTDSPGDVLIRGFEEKLASAPQGSVDPYAHLSNEINYTDSGNGGIVITEEDAKSWPTACLMMSGLAMFVAALKCSVWTLIPALQQGWDTPLAMVMTRRGVQTGSVFHLTAGQYVIENAFILGVGPVLLVIGVLGTIYKVVVAPKRVTA
jgi:hypothetical protein